MKHPLITEAIEFIEVAHAGQMYGDMAYFQHPIEVANAIPNATDTEYLVALLHDVVEDTEYSIDYITRRWGSVIAEAVALVTKEPNLSYEENIARIIDSGNRTAMRVKLADNRVNFNGDKSHMSTDRALRLLAKYSWSIKQLETALYATYSS